MTPPPLPTVPAVLNDDAGVLVTGDRSKLPADIAVLLDVSVPVPVGVQFFEKKITLVDMLSTAAWSVGLGGFGVFCVVFGLTVLIRPTGPVTVISSADWAPLGFGVVCLFAAWMMAGRAIAQLALRGSQRAGRPTRVGIFLTPSCLIESTTDAWCVLPPGSIRGVADDRVTYVLKGQEKSIRLPADLIAGEPRLVAPAVRQWLSRRPKLAPAA